MIKKVRFIGILLTILGAVSVSTLAPIAYADDASASVKAAPTANHAKMSTKTKGHTKTKMVAPQ